ncbi:MAG: enoyl-CoA hydratase/isomerase family protein [Dehalococcoidales bacterium]|nr:MAG: enoyl-CoA hydratase/isomerase family protein [Dehalococcoidales bacterium]
MAYEDLLLEKEEAIAIVALNVPDKLNPITGKMGVSLSLAADEIAKDNEIRAVIVTGAGRGFSSGADVSGMARAQQGSGGQAAAPAQPVEIPRQSRYQPQGYPFADVFPKLNKPVIAAINGPCAGGGFSLALSCDIRIASESARFIVSQVARGLNPDWGMTYYLPMAIGMSRALELMFTVDMIDAASAERMGIVSKVVPHDKLMDEARELAAKICKQPPIAVELAKKVVWQGRLDDLNRQLDLETWALRISQQTEDYRESVRAFMEKREAQFKGR